MARDVVDKDLGWRAIARAAAQVDGMELRNGILDHRLRYKSSTNAEGQYISKVAAIHGVYRAIADGYEDKRGNTDAGMNKLLRAIHAGTSNPAALIHELIGVPIRDAMRSAVYRVVKRKSGRMAAAVRSTVFAAGRIGTRQAGFRGKKLAGDNPSAPKASQGV